MAVKFEVDWQLLREIPILTHQLLVTHVIYGIFDLNNLITKVLHIH